MPLVATMFSVYVPGEVADIVLTVNTDVLAFGSVMLTELGLNELLASVGGPVTFRVTPPVNPPTGVMVTV